MKELWVCYSSELFDLEPRTGQTVSPHTILAVLEWGRPSRTISSRTLVCIYQAHMPLLPQTVVRKGAARGWKDANILALWERSIRNNEKHSLLTSYFYLISFFFFKWNSKYQYGVAFSVLFISTFVLSFVSDIELSQLFSSEFPCDQPLSLFACGCLVFVFPVLGFCSFPPYRWASFLEAECRSVGTRCV